MILRRKYGSWQLSVAIFWGKHNTTKQNPQNNKKVLKIIDVHNGTSMSSIVSIWSNFLWSIPSFAKTYATVQWDFSKNKWLSSMLFHSSYYTCVSTPQAKKKFVNYHEGKWPDKCCKVGGLRWSRNATPFP